MQIIQIEDWNNYKNDGEQFLSTAIAAFTKKKKAFSSETLYNLTCMAIEKYIMAFLMKNGDLADNHTMIDMVRSLERHLKLSPDLVEKLLFLDQFQEICDLDNYSVRVPAEEDTITFLATGQQLREYLMPYLEDGNNRPH
jgi:HEPN domain-containing protein